MITTPAETKLVEFLTNEENLPFTVEILRLGDQVRKPILARFWRDLKCQLDKMRPPGRAASMVLRFLPNDRLTDPSNVELDYFESALENESQFLRYCIAPAQGKGYFEIEYGIAWRDEDNIPATAARLSKLDPMVALRKKLTSMDFKEEDAWVGWQPLHDCKYYESVEEFLAFIAKAPEEALGNMADRFWSLVSETLSSVEEANRAIVGKK